ncbi:MAG: hypothetical protein NT010_00560 [Proteobacteria bacterium]|nr:hypothetical protein [Pseudomonadota bacterium]
MKTPNLFKVLRRILPLAAIFIILIFSISVFDVQGNDDGLYFPWSQYLSSDDQDDDPGLDEGGACTDINAEMFADIPEPQLSSEHLLKREAGLQVLTCIIASHTNRAPPQI